MQLLEKYLHAKFYYAWGTMNYLCAESVTGCSKKGMMQINASNISYLPSITHTFNGNALSITLVYTKNCIDTKEKEVLYSKTWSNRF